MPWSAPVPYRPKPTMVSLLPHPLPPAPPFSGLLCLGPDQGWLCKPQAELRFLCYLGAHSLPGAQSSSKEWDGDFEGLIVDAIPRQRQRRTWGLMTKMGFTGQAGGDSVQESAQMMWNTLVPVCMDHPGNLEMV